MKKFILPILVCIFLLLCSCSGYLPNKENSGSSAQSVSMPEEDSSSEEQSSSSLESEQPDSGEDIQTQSDTSDSQSVATENLKVQETKNHLHLPIRKYRLMIKNHRNNHNRRKSLNKSLNHPIPRKHLLQHRNQQSHRNQHLSRLYLKKNRLTSVHI